MAAKNLLLLLIVILSLISRSTSISDETILDAAKLLSNSGFNAMGLTLKFGSDILIPPQSASLTIFSPFDSAFVLSGQPSLSLLHFHFSPNLKTLKSLPSGSIIQTLTANHNLTVTSSGNRISINNVAVHLPPIYDNESLVIYGVDRFLNPYGGGGVRSYGSGGVQCFTVVNLATVVMFSSLFLNGL